MTCGQPAEAIMRMGSSLNTVRIFTYPNSIGSSLAVCQSLLLHNATHPGVMQSEMISDLLQTVTTAGVSIENCLVSCVCLGDLG